MESRSSVIVPSSAASTAAALLRRFPPPCPSVVEEARSHPCAATPRSTPSWNADPAPWRSTQESLIWCMAKISAVDEHCRPSLKQTSATSPSEAPSPPSAHGTAMPISRCAFSAARASAGKRASRSTAAAHSPATAAAASARSTMDRASDPSDPRVGNAMSNASSAPPPSMPAAPESAWAVTMPRCIS